MAMVESTPPPRPPCMGIGTPLRMRALEFQVREMHRQLAAERNSRVDLSGSSSPSQEASGCPICLEPLKSRGAGRQRSVWTSGCGHSFPHECIKEYFLSNSSASCPLCRQGFT